MLKPKLQYFGHRMQRADSLEKTLMLGKIESKRRREWQRMRWLDGITDSMDVSLSKGQRSLTCYSPWNCRVRHDLATEQQQNIYHSIIYNSQLWKQPKCTQMAAEWVKKLWQRYLYYSAIKKNEILSFATIWMDLEGIMLNQINQVEKDKYHMHNFISFIWIISGLVHCDDPEGWDGEGGGSGIGMGNTCKSMADSCQCMVKTTTIL